jgi:hypothetical protein
MATGQTIIEVNKMAEITIEVNRDAHDDTYYRILSGDEILMDRVNNLSDVILFVKAKLKTMG